MCEMNNIITFRIKLFPMKTNILLIILLLTQTLFTTNYYVSSSNGDDNNDGISPASP